MNLPTAIQWALGAIEHARGLVAGALARGRGPLSTKPRARRDELAQFAGMWWSGWFLVLIPIALLWAVPTVWGYWVIDQPLATKYQRSGARICS